MHLTLLLYVYVTRSADYVIHTAFQKIGGEDDFYVQEQKKRQI